MDPQRTTSQPTALQPTASQLIASPPDSSQASPPASAQASRSIAALLQELEERSRARPDRVLRLRGQLPAEAFTGDAAEALPEDAAANACEAPSKSQPAPQAERQSEPQATQPATQQITPQITPQTTQQTTPQSEPFELLIFRGFSSLTTHPTAFDPDRPALPQGAMIESAELLQAPLNPEAAVVLAGPMAVERLLGDEGWG